MLEKKTTLTKEPWQMTRDEYRSQELAPLRKGERVIASAQDVTSVDNAHKRVIKQALSEGKPVSPEVLKALC